MKIQYILAISLSLCFGNLQSQNWISTGAVLNNGTGGNNTIGTFNNFSMRFFTNNVNRMQITPNSNLIPPFNIFGNNTGYIGIGINNNMPLFHTDILTPAIGWGELHLGVGPSDVPNSKSGFLNAAIGNGLYLPTMFGHLDATQAEAAIQTLGNIDPAQDLAPGINNAPVHRFVVGRGLAFYQTGVGQINQITNRIAFTWNNANANMMMMNAAGRLRIGNNLIIPANLPRNRVEITSSAGANPGLNDPYFGTVFGSSGLRFTNLTSITPSVVPNGTNGVNSSRVLTVDQNGDVVLTNPVAVGTPNANQGLQVNAGFVQLGGLCATPASITGGSRAIDMNGNFFEWRNGRTGFGTAGCAVNNRVEITGLAANASGLRFTNLTSASPAILNTTNKVLTVNNTGDVILVNETTGNNGIQITNGVAQLGVPCPSPISTITQNWLTSNRQIHLHGFNLIFNDGGRVGFGFVPNACNVGNKVEIRSTGLDPYFSNIFGWGSSGLRLSNLTAGNNPVPNGTNGTNYAKVLSVDANGDVVLVPNTIGTATIIANNGNSVSGGNVQLGATCGSASVAAGALTNNREVQMANNNLIFSETTSGTGKVGIGNIAVCTPGNLLEVSKNNTTPSAIGLSGLRLTDLKSGAGTVPSNGKVLTVDANGDVVLTTDVSGTVAAGSIFAQNGLSLVGTNTVELGGTLLHNTNINFTNITNKFDLTYTDNSVLHYQRSADGGQWQFALGHNNKDGQAGFSDQFYSTASSNFNVGRLLNVQPVASVVAPSFYALVGDEVIVSGTPTTGIGGVDGNVYGYYSATENRNGNSGNNYANASWGQGAPSIPGAINAAYFARAEKTTNIIGQNIGFYADMANGSYQATKDFGVHTNVTSNANTTETYGGYFKASYGQNVYGIYAEANPGSGTSYAGYFKGDVFINGPSQIAGLAQTVSDQMFKTNIDSIANVQNIIKQLKPKTFYYDTTNVNNINFSSRKQYGLIAQDVQTILPELVGNTTKPAEYDSIGNVTAPSVTYKNLNYNAFIAILIKGMQQQQRMIEKQDSIINLVQSQISALSSSVSSCCSNSTIRETTAFEQNQLTISLSDADAIVLNQNVPNPFAEQTTITYNVPEKYGYAQMVFNTIEGRILKTVDITKKGRGTINVFANDLGSGMYTYSLIVDGKVIDAKKMVKSE